MIATGDPREQRVRALLAEVASGNPFYARKLAGWDGRDLNSVPFTTKAELVSDQLDHPPYGSNRTYPPERYCRLHQTSGTSSGRPLRWLDTPESWEWLLGCWHRIFSGLGLRPGDVFFFPFSFGPFLGFWTAFEAAAREGFLVLPGGGLTSTARLRFLLEHRATVVCATPTYALHLAELAAEEGIDLAGSPVRLVIVAGEPGGSIPATRARIEAVWGARVIDHYGMTELGPVAAETTDRPGSLVVLDDHFVAEVLEPDGTRIAAPGAVGELVLTNLGRTGSPLIRYRTGDVVKVQRDAAGILQLPGGILGRTDDMLHVRGNNLYPAAIEAVVRRFPEVAEFRIVVDRSGPLADLCVEIEPRDGTVTGGLADVVARAIRDELLFRVPVAAVAVGSLPRYEMKARRVLDKR
ncbi:MAG TPA: AMP-binding protein [Gemmataceae bacterium]|jgi:phenylacetate-CoA ligase|nr:AMP-binding protein [Gemmataceae bacterium]